MKSLRNFDRRAGYLLAAVSLLVAMVAPGLLTATVYAGTVSTRSIQLSSATANATGVSYDVTFTPTATAAAYTVDFCNDSPIVGATCTAPSGFSTSGVTVGTSTVTATVASRTGNYGVAVTTALTAGTPNHVVLVGLHNPTSATGGSTNFYARIITYDTSSHATTSTPIGSAATGAIDQGGIAMAITNDIAVSAAVLETMTFCVSGATITSNCASTTAPNLTLGETSGTVTALNPSALSTGSIYTQISTNAASGAIINMKSSAAGCGGLLRAGGGSACDIAPSSVAGFSAGAAKFGVKTGTATGTTGALVASGSYNSSTYFMNYVAGEATGVTSPYGDPFLTTSGAPANNMNMTLTFGASASATTPAGLYSANLNLIATGKF